METRVIGVGNEFRRDDAVGPLAARRLRDQVPQGVCVLEATGEGAALLELFKGAGCVYIVDAVRSGRHAGAILRLDAVAAPIPSEYFAASTHAFGVAEAIDMARALGSLPPRLIVYAVEGEAFEQGIGLTARVEEALETVARRILEELSLR